MALSRPAEVAGPVAAAVVRARLAGRRRFGSVAFGAAVVVATGIALVALAVLVVQVVLEGTGVLVGRFHDFFTGTLQSLPERAGIAQGLRGTFWIGVTVVVLAFPVGIAAAVWLEEFAPGTRLARIVDVNIRNLAGVPSIVYGILGFALFVKAAGSVTGGRSVIAAGLTLSVLVLPVVIVSAAEAIRAVPRDLREAGFALGATPWEVVRHQVLPYAAPGVLTGTILALARALGEAAPLILVGAVTNRLGSNPAVWDLGSLRDRFTALPMVITSWAGQAQGGFRANTAAAIVVLMAIVLGANAAAIVLRDRYERRRSGR
jgi:phosphate transport system permease protein